MRIRFIVWQRTSILFWLFRSHDQSSVTNCGDAWRSCYEVHGCKYLPLLRTSSCQVYNPQPSVFNRVFFSQNFFFIKFIICFVSGFPLLDQRQGFSDFVSGHSRKIFHDFESADFFHCVAENIYSVLVISEPSSILCNNLWRCRALLYRTSWLQLPDFAVILLLSGTYTILNPLCSLAL